MHRLCSLRPSDNEFRQRFIVGNVPEGHAGGGNSVEKFIISCPFKDYDELKTLAKQNCRSVSKALTGYKHDLGRLSGPPGTICTEGIGLMLEDARTILKRLQATIVVDQVEENSRTSQVCPDRRTKRRIHDTALETSTSLKLKGNL